MKAIPSGLVGRKRGMGLCSHNAVRRRYAVRHRCRSQPPGSGVSGGGSGDGLAHPEIRRLLRPVTRALCLGDGRGRGRGGVALRRGLRQGASPAVFLVGSGCRLRRRGGGGVGAGRVSAWERASAWERESGFGWAGLRRGRLSAVTGVGRRRGRRGRPGRCGSDDTDGLGDGLSERAPAPLDAASASGSRDAQAYGPARPECG